MKFKLSIPGAALLVSIYCFALGMAGAHTGLRGDYSQMQSGTEKFFSTVCSNLYSHLPSSVQEFNSEKLPENAQKNDVRNFKATARFLANLAITQITRYGHFSENLRVHFRKNDSLFPFQYFW